MVHCLLLLLIESLLNGTTGTLYRIIHDKLLLTFISLLYSSSTVKILILQETQWNHDNHDNYIAAFNSFPRNVVVECVHVEMTVLLYWVTLCVFM